jgi:hypothetical protein
MTTDVSSTEVKKEWSYTSTPIYIFRAWCSIKHIDTFPFNFSHACFMLHQLDLKTELFLSRFSCYQSHGNIPAQFPNENKFPAPTLYTSYSKEIKLKKSLPTTMPEKKGVRWIC